MFAFVMNHYRKIQQYYFHILKHGTNVYQSSAIETHITTTSFLVKEENCIGLQIADLIAYNCVKYINGITPKHNMWNIIDPKLYDGVNNEVDLYGLVKLF